MTGLHASRRRGRLTFPRSWDEVASAHAERVASFVEGGVARLRRERHACSTYHRSWPIHLVAPEGSVGVVRRLFPGRFDRGEGVFFVSGVQVLLHASWVQGREVDLLDLTWHSRSLCLQVPPLPLTAAQWEVYARLRADGALPDRAAALARLLG